MSRNKYKDIVILELLSSIVVEEPVNKLKYKIMDYSSLNVKAT